MGAAAKPSDRRPAGAAAARARAHSAGLRPCRCSPASLELNPYRTKSFLDQPDNVKVGTPTRGGGLRSAACRGWLARIWQREDSCSARTPAQQHGGCTGMGRAAAPAAAAALAPAPGVATPPAAGRCTELLPLLLLLLLLLAPGPGSAGTACLPPCRAPTPPGCPSAARPAAPAPPQDFATLQSMMEEIQANIALRQDTISLLTGEVGAAWRAQLGAAAAALSRCTAPCRPARWVLPRLGAAGRAQPGAAFRPSSASCHRCVRLAVGVGGLAQTQPPACPCPQVTRLKGQMQAAQGLSPDAGLPSHSSVAPLPAPASNGRPAMPAPAVPPPAFSAPAPSLGAALPSVFSGDGKKDVAMYGASVAAVVFFAGVVAPVLEERVGLGGEPRCCCVLVPPAACARYPLLLVVWRLLLFAGRLHAACLARQRMLTSCGNAGCRAAPPRHGGSCAPHPRLCLAPLASSSACFPWPCVQAPPTTTSSPAAACPPRWPRSGADTRGRGSAATGGSCPGAGPSPLRLPLQGELHASGCLVGAAPAACSQRLAWLPLSAWGGCPPGTTATHQPWATPPTNQPQVDPIVASHAGGAVGIMTAQLLSSNKRRQ